MYLTLGQAARESGLSKSTLSRAIKKGKLSADPSDDTGTYRIDPAELCRYLGAVKVLRAIAEPVAVIQSATGGVSPAEQPETLTLQVQIDGLRQLNELLKAQIDETRRDRDDNRRDMRDQLDDARRERDHWREAAASNQRLLAPPPPKSWWPWRRAG